MKTLTRFTMLFAIIAAALLPAAVGFAQDYPLESGGLTIDLPGERPDEDGRGRPSVAPGRTFRVVGGGFAPGAEVTITIESEPLELVVTRADGRGDVDVEVSVPASFPAGEHTVKATGPSTTGASLVLAQPVEVAAAGPADDGATAAATPTAVEETSRDRVAVAALTAGGLLLVVATGVFLLVGRPTRLRR